MIYSSISYLLLLSPQAPAPATPDHQSPDRSLVVLDQVLPAKTLAVVSMPPVSNFRDQLAGTKVWDLFQTIAPVANGEFFAASLKQHGLDTSGASDVFSHGFSLALTKLQPPAQVHWIFVARTGGRATSLRQTIAKAHTHATGHGYVVHSETIQKSSVWCLTSPQGDKNYYTITDEMIVASNSAEAVEDILNRVVRGGSSLANSPTYRQFVAKAPTRGTRVFTLFVQPQLILKNLLTQLPLLVGSKGQKDQGVTGSSWDEIVEKLEILRVSEFGMVVHADEKNVREFVWTGYAAPRSGLFAALLCDANTIKPEHCRVIAPDIISASLFHIDLARIYSESITLARLIDPSHPQIANTWLQGLKKRTGVDLQTEVLDLLGKTVAFQQWAAKDSSSTNFALSLAVGDWAVVDKALEDLAAAFRIPSRRIADKNVHVLPGLSLSLPSAFVFVHKGHLILTDSPYSTTRIVATLDSGESNEGLLELLGTLPKPPNALSWGSSATLGEQWLRNLSVEFGNRKSADELTRIVTAAGGSIVSDVKSDEHGIAASSVSPFGNVYLTLSAAYFLRKHLSTGGATGGATTREQRLRSTLNDILAAQRDFRDMRSKDTDGDKSGEFGTMQELVESGLLNARRFRGTVGDNYGVEGYTFKIFLPTKVDDREQRFLVLLWPTEEKTGPVYAGTESGDTYGNRIIAHSEGMKVCDPRDFYHLGSFGGKILPMWDVLESEADPEAVTAKTRSTDATFDDAEAFARIIEAERTKEVTPQIIRLLDNGNPKVAARAAYALGQLKFKKAVPQLCAIVREYDHPDVRRQAMAALGRMHDRRSRNTSIDALSSSDPELRSLAAQNLGFLHAESAAGPLLAMLAAASERNAPDRIAALLALADIGKPDYLIEAATAVRNPGKRDEGALVYLFQTLSTRLAPTEEETALIAILDNKSRLLRRYAIQRLGILKLTSSEKALEGRLAKETVLQDLIKVSLTEIRCDPDTDKGAVGFVTEAKKKAIEVWKKTRVWWDSLSRPKRYAVAGSGAFCLLLMVMLARMRRKRRLRARGEAMAAMVAPSDGFEKEHEAEYDDYSEEREAYEDDGEDEDGGRDDGKDSVSETEHYGQIELSDDEQYEDDENYEEVSPHSGGRRGSR